MVGKTRLLVFLFCMKKENRTFFFFSYLSFFPFQYNLMHYYQLRTITIKLVCQTMMNVGVFNKYLNKIYKVDFNHSGHRN